MTRILTTIMVLIATVTAASSVLAQTDTTFTYQGELNDNGSPANGVFNIDFSLWDAVTGGNQIGTTDTNIGVPVVAGKFTVELDFSAFSFDNSNRWLEITVNGTMLSPRNPITRAPYAIQTRGIFVDTYQRVGIGGVNPGVALHVAGNQPILWLDHEGDAGQFQFRDTGPTQAQIQKFNGTGGVLIDIDPIPLDETSSASLRLFRSTNTSGLKRVLFYSGNNSTTTTAAIGLDGANSYFQLQGGRFGIGTDNPYTPLHVESDIDFFPIIYGLATSLTGSTSGVSGESKSVEGTGVLGHHNSANGIGYGVRGMSNSPTGFDFYANGAGINYGSSSSRRWKSNIETIDQPLTKISQLEGVYFDWDQQHGGHHDVGMIAEEVGKVLPEIVQFEANGFDAIGMDYSKLTPLLVEAVKALQQEKNAEITDLKQQNDSLQKANDDLLSRLEAIERQLMTDHQGNLK